MEDGARQIVEYYLVKKRQGNQGLVFWHRNFLVRARKESFVEVTSAGEGGALNAGISGTDLGCWGGGVKKEWRR